MKRRAIGEAVAAITLLAVTGTVMAIVASSSQMQVSSSQESVSDSIDTSAKRVQELISLIDVTKEATVITAEMINYGTAEIQVATIMVDGEESPFAIMTLDGSPIKRDILPIREIVIVKIQNSGDSFQIVTSSGNIFDFGT